MLLLISSPQAEHVLSWLWCLSWIEAAVTYFLDSAQWASLLQGVFPAPGRNPGELDSTGHELGKLVCRFSWR